MSNTSLAQVSDHPVVAEPLETFEAAVGRVCRDIDQSTRRLARVRAELEAHEARDADRAHRHRAR